MTNEDMVFQGEEITIMKNRGVLREIIIQII